MVAIPPTALKLIEALHSIGRIMEKGYELLEGRVERLEEHFRGNGESILTRLRVMADSLKYLEERQASSAEHAEQLLAIQMAQLEERRKAALLTTQKDLQRQLDTYGTDLARMKKSLEDAQAKKWDMLKLLLTALLGACVTIAVTLLKK